jgi:hypothetical protein
MLDHTNLEEFANPLTPDSTSVISVCRKRD